MLKLVAIGVLLFLIFAAAGIVGPGELRNQLLSLLAFIAAALMLGTAFFRSGKKDKSAAVAEETTRQASLGLIAIIFTVLGLVFIVGWALVEWASVQRLKYRPEVVYTPPPEPAPSPAPLPDLPIETTGQSVAFTVLVALLFLAAVIGGFFAFTDPFRRLYLRGVLAKLFSRLPTQKEMIRVNLSDTPINEMMPGFLKALYDAIPTEVPPIPEGDTDDDNEDHDERKRPVGKYRRKIRMFIAAHSDRSRALRTFRRVAKGTIEALELPPLREDPTFGTIRLLDLVDVRDAVSRIRTLFFDKDGTVEASGIFEDLRHRLNINRDRISYLTYTDKKYSEPMRLDPKEFDPRAKPEKVVETYLKETPLTMLFDAETRVPYAPGLTSRLEHMHIVAHSGHGKTQALARLIWNDLSSPEPPSIVVIDPHGDQEQSLASELLHLQEFEDGDRLVIIDPRDTPAIGLFDIPLKGLTDDVVANTTGQLEYFINSLLEQADLTTPMSTVLRPLTQLMMHIPDATLYTLVNAINDIKAQEFESVLKKLPPRTQQFLREELPKTHPETKKAVRGRIYGIAQTAPHFEKMFCAPRNLVNVPEIIASGKLLVVTPTTPPLEDGHARLFGRFFIDQVFRAVRARSGKNRRPVFLYVDEAWKFFDTNIDHILVEARKFGLGLILAHQVLGHATEGLRASLNTVAIKLAAGDEASALGRSMRADPGFIANMQGSRGNWALWDRHAGLKQAVRLRVQPDALKSQPPMSDGAYIQLRERNRKRLVIPSPPPTPPKPVVPKPARAPSWKGVE